MKIGNTRFWFEKNKRSVGIRASNYETGQQPFELYLGQYWHLPSFKLYQSENENDQCELRVSTSFLWLTLNLLLWTYKDLKVNSWDSAATNKPKEWGCSSYERNNYAFFWGHWRKYIDLPFASMVFVQFNMLSLDQQTVVYSEGSKCEFELREAIRKAHSMEMPYRYVCKNGDMQDVTATVNVEQYVRRYKWTPFKQVSTSINVHFSEEVGEGRGLWKGGCIGCGYTIKKGETALRCLFRMEQERKFER